MVSKEDGAGLGQFFIVVINITLSPCVSQVTYGFDSCIMGQVGYIVPRLIVG